MTLDKFSRVSAPTGSQSDQRLLLLGPGDNVLVARQRVASGERLTIDGTEVTLAAELSIGHKLARVAIQPGDKITKYGAPIGVATQPIAPGEHVHVHNVRSDYTPTHHLYEAEGKTT